MKNEMTTRSNEAFTLTSFEQAERLAKYIADSDFAPKDYKGKPANILIAMQMGAEVGLKPMQAIQNIAVVNGRPCLWGDAMLALVKSHPDCEWVKETMNPTGTIATCEVKRRNEAICSRSFSTDDAKKAGLFNKDGVWQKYPQRMLQLRARGFAIRDSFPDALRGLNSAEEVQDYDEPSQNTSTPLESLPIVNTLINCSQLHELQMELQQREVDIDKFYKYFEITRLPDLSSTNYEKALQMLQAKPLKMMHPIMPKGEPGELVTGEIKNDDEKTKEFFKTVYDMEEKSKEELTKQTLDKLETLKNISKK